MSNPINDLYNRFKTNLIEDGYQAHQMELARRRYKEHLNKGSR